MSRRGVLNFLIAGILASFAVSASGGLYNEADARSAALGGEEAAQTTNVFSAMDSNPAALTSLDRPEAAITLTGALLRGEFDRQKRSSSLRDGNGFIGSAAVEIPAPRQWPIRFGLAVIPDLALEGNWRYLDPPGGLGGTTSYGIRDQQSEILSLRTTAAIAVEATRALSLGASAGFVYNRNELHAPYIFQISRSCAVSKHCSTSRLTALRRPSISARSFIQMRS